MVWLAKVHHSRVFQLRRKRRPKAMRLKAHKCPEGKQLIANLSEGRVAAEAKDGKQNIEATLTVPEKCTLCPYN